MISQRNSGGREGNPGSTDGVDRIVGESKAAHTLRQQAMRVARSAARAVLITGESGTGKGLVARVIHAASDRADHPFIPITCSAIPDHLLESELFGHEAGAFTDGRTKKTGLLEAASGGTVFLDEVGDMAPPLQAKLLGVLEDRKLRRIGGLSEVRVDIRVVSATHRDLRSMVDDGSFREDLLHRLRVVPLRVPPLRDRLEDISSLAELFVTELGGGHNEVRGISRDAIQRLQTREWPGNVRELRNEIERAVVFSTGLELGPDDFEWPTDAPRSTVALPTDGIDVETLVNDLVCAAMQRTRGNQSAAARLLGLSRNQVRHRLEGMGLLPPSRRRVAHLRLVKGRASASGAGVVVRPAAPQRR